MKLNLVEKIAGNHGNINKRRTVNVYMLSVN